MVPDFLGKAVKIDLHKSSDILPESYIILANSLAATLLELEKSAQILTAASTDMVSAFCCKKHSNTQPTN